MAARKSPLWQTVRDIYIHEDFIGVPLCDVINITLFTFHNHSHHSSQMFPSEICLVLQACYFIVASCLRERGRKVTVVGERNTIPVLGVDLRDELRVGASSSVGCLTMLRAATLCEVRWGSGVQSFLFAYHLSCNSSPTVYPPKLLVYNSSYTRSEIYS
jgi:hypothetical protein